MGRDSKSKRLGIKINNGETASAGEIIIRQRGTHYLPGMNVGRSGDDTLYALKNGVVNFKQARKTCFDGSRRFAKKVMVTEQ